MNAEHPKAIYARQMSAKRSLERSMLNVAKTAYDIRFLTVGNYTICYRKKEHDVIELSTTLRNPSDRFDRHVGQLVAFDRFTDNKRIQLKKSRKHTIKKFLETLFSTAQ